MRVGLLATLAVVLAGVAVLLAQSGPRVTGSNNVFERFTNVTLEPGQQVCENGEVLPDDTGTVRLTAELGERAGPAVALRVLDADGRTLRRGSRAAGWRGKYLDVPIETIQGEQAPVRICVLASGPGALPLRGFGTGDEKTGFTLNGQDSTESLRMTYLTGAEKTWWAVAGSVLERVGRARGELVDGWWVPVAWLAALVALMALVVLAAAPSRRAVRRLPLTAWLCAGVAALSGLGWAALTPAFHVPDEVAHFAYAQYLAETGDLPKVSGDLRYAPEEEATLALLQFYFVVGDVSARPPSTEFQDEAMDGLPRAGRTSTGSAQSASNNPPLYYGLQALPYYAGIKLNLLDRLMLMRAFSVLFAALTAMGVFLFLREVMPSTPWAATAGGLAVALQPLFGFISAGVQGDALLYAAGVWLFYALARAFKRGLTPATGAAIGAAVAVGLLSKLQFLGLVPGAALAVLVLLWRSRTRPALRGALVALAVAAVPVGLYMAANVLVFDRPVFTGATPGATTVAVEGAPAPKPPDLREGIGYVWQLYLPRLPFMTDQFPTSFPGLDVWLEGLIGRYGWLETRFPDFVYGAGGWGLLALLGLGLIELVRSGRRGALAGRVAELACYAVLVAGLLSVIGWAGYRTRIAGPDVFEQARYLLPLLALYGAAVAGSARLLGARLGPVAAGVLIGLALGHDLFAQLLVAGRFYG